MAAPETGRRGGRGEYRAGGGHLRWVGPADAHFLDVDSTGTTAGAWGWWGPDADRPTYAGRTLREARAMVAALAEGVA